MRRKRLLRLSSLRSSQRSSRPEPYLQYHENLTAPMLTILFDWLIELTTEYR